MKRAVSLDPTFNKNVVSYEATTSNATNTVTATATDSDAGVVITVNGNSVTSGSSVTWAEGVNNVAVTVTNGGSRRTYTVAVTKEEWLDEFNTFSIYQVLPKIIELWGLNMKTDVEAKKNFVQQTVK